MTKASYGVQVDHNLVFSIFEYLILLVEIPLWLKSEEYNLR